MIRRVILILCITITLLAAIMWPTSYIYTMCVDIPLPWFRPDTSIVIHQKNGCTQIAWEWFNFGESEFGFSVERYRNDAHHYLTLPVIKPSLYHPSQFKYRHKINNYGKGKVNEFYYLRFANYLPLIIFAPYPIYCYFKYRHRKLRPDPHCAQCDYNLRGSMDSETCPECGCPIERG